MKDEGNEGVTESQVYSHESPASRRSQVGEKSEKLARSKFIYISHLSFVAFVRFFARGFSFCGRKFEAINKPHREGKKQINLFSIHNAHCLIELDPNLRSPKKRREL